MNRAADSKHSKRLWFVGKELPLLVALKEACHRARSLDIRGGGKMEADSVEHTAMEFNKFDRLERKKGCPQPCSAAIHGKQIRIQSSQHFLTENRRNRSTPLPAPVNPLHFQYQ
jgi:hypothetical protein